MGLTGQLKKASVQGQVAPRYDPVFDPQSAATSEIIVIFPNIMKYQRLADWVLDLFTLIQYYQITQCSMVWNTNITQWIADWVRGILGMMGGMVFLRNSPGPWRGHCCRWCSQSCRLLLLARAFPWMSTSWGRAMRIFSSDVPSTASCWNLHAYLTYGYGLTTCAYMI